MVEHPNSTDSYSDFGVFEDRLPPFSFSDAWVVGWRALKRNYWILVGGAVGFFALQSALNVVASVLSEVAERNPEGGVLLALSGILQMFNAVFIAPMVYAGFLYMGLLSVRWQGVGLGKLVFGFTRYWSLLRTVLLEFAIWTGICVVLLVLVALGFTVGFGIDAAMGNVEIASPFEGDLEPKVATLICGFGSLLMAFLALLRIAPRFWFMTLLVIDPMSEANTARAALRGSWDMTREHKWTVLGLIVLLSLMSSLSMLLCFLPAFFLGLPLAACIQAASYEMMRNSRDHLPGLDERDELPVREEGE